jgi:hypothetical protein
VPRFIPGLALAEVFYTDAIKPILDQEFPGLRYAIGRIGSGSDVLGFDTKQSTDHDWGARIELFLSEEDYKRYRERIDEVLRRRLPAAIHGYPTNFGDPAENKVRVMGSGVAGNINHRVEIYTVKSFFQNYLYWKPGIPTTKDWLVFPEQKLATIKYGRIFHDTIELNRTRKTLEYYPRDVWLYLLACQWTKISQEEPFVGRCGDVGDELGSRIIAARLVNDVMRLCFLMEKQYAPYSKWFGTGFSRLKCAKRLSPLMNRVLDAKKWKTRQKNLAMLYREVASMHNALRITKPLPTKASLFYGRPYLVIHGGMFAEQILLQVKDKRIKKLKPIGSVNQFSNSTDLLETDTTPFKSVYESNS